MGSGEGTLGTNVFQLKDYIIQGPRQCSQSIRQLQRFLQRILLHWELNKQVILVVLGRKRLRIKTRAPILEEDLFVPLIWSNSSSNHWF